MFEGKRVLITGGAGFIGSSLAQRLAHHGADVVLFDNLHRNALARTGLLEHPRVSLIQGDVLDERAVRAAVEGAHMVVHMASIAGVDTVMRMPVETMTVSLIGTWNVLRAAQEAGNVERLVDFSTSEVFGRFAFRVSEGDVTQLGAVGEARWTYAVSKLATEHLAHCYYKQLELPTVAIRPFNIYGPNQVGEGAVHHFIVRAIKGEPLTIHHLAKEIVRLSSSSSRIDFVKWDFPDVDLRIPNIDKARERLGFEPRIDLEEGLLRTIYWYRNEVL